MIFVQLDSFTCLNASYYQMTPGKRLAAMRKKRGMAQLQLADKMADIPGYSGTNQTTVSTWEQDNTRLTHGHMVALSEVLGCSYTIFFEDPETWGKTASSEVRAMLEGGREILESLAANNVEPSLLRDLSPSEIDYVMEQMALVWMDGLPENARELLPKLLNDVVRLKQLRGTRPKGS